MKSLTYLLLLTSLVFSDDLFIGIGSNISRLDYRDFEIAEIQIGDQINISPFNMELLYEYKIEDILLGGGIGLTSFGYEQSIRNIVEDDFDNVQVITLNSKERHYFISIPLMIGINLKPIASSLHMSISYNSAIFRYLKVESDGDELTSKNYYDSYWNNYWAYEFRVRKRFEIKRLNFYTEIFGVKDLNGIGTDSTEIHLYQAGARFGMFFSL